MKRSSLKSLGFLLRLCLLCLSLTLCACGPKEIGSGSAKADDNYHAGPPDPVAEMRYPMALSNSNVDKYFYTINQPAVFEHIQQRNIQNFMRRHGGDTAGINPEHPAYRSVPKQRSPFRQ